MKELYDYINEVRISKEEIERSIVLTDQDLNSNLRNPLNPRNFFNTLFDPIANKALFTKTSNEKYNRLSLSNISHQNKLYNSICNVKIYIDQINYGNKQTVAADIENILSERYQVTDGYSLACFLLKNVNFFSDKRNTNAPLVIKNLDLSTIGKEYEIFKNSEEFQPGELFDVNKFDPKSETKDSRILVLYDCADPKNKEKTYFFTIPRKCSGKNAEYVEYLINMHKMTYQKITKIPYFDVRPILAVNYIKKSAKFLEEKYFLQPVQGVLKEIN